MKKVIKKMVIAAIRSLIPELVIEVKKYASDKKVLKELILEVLKEMEVVAAEKLLEAKAKALDEIDLDEDEKMKFLSSN